MKANELMIGNWVKRKSDGLIYRIVEILEYTVTMVPLNDGSYFKTKERVIFEDIESIPITPEILEKAGFEEIYKSSMHTTFYKDKVSYYFWHQTNRQYADFIGNQYDHIQNIHQLQNLYFACTLTLRPHSTCYHWGRAHPLHSIQQPIHGWLCSLLDPTAGI